MASAADGGRRSDGRPARLLERAAGGLTFWSFFLFGLFLLFVGLWIPAERQYHRSCSDENSLKREIRRLSQSNRELKACLEAIRTDPYYVEKVLREQQGLAARGELVVRNRMQVIPGE